MNRRVFIGTLSALAVSATLPRAVRSASMDGPSPMRSVSLRRLLPTSDSLPDDFELVTATTGLDPRQSPRDVAGTIPDDAVVRGCAFGPPGHPNPGDNIVTCDLVRLPNGDQQSTRIDTRHELLRCARRPGRSSGGGFTDWVTTESTTTTVDGRRRTVDWIRAPVLRERPTATSISKPTVERAAAIQSTSWGLIVITADRYPAADGESRDDAVALLEDVHQHSCDAPEPSFVPTAPLPIDWDDLSERLRGEVTAEVVQAVASTGLDADAIAAAVAARYDAPEAAVHEYIDWGYIRDRDRLVTSILRGFGPDETVASGDPRAVADRAARHLDPPPNEVEEIARDLRQRDPEPETDRLLTDHHRTNDR